MPYRVCKSFTIESGHMLSKHPGRCKHPHGHSRTVEVVVASDTLDANDMVCDFKALKVAIADFLDQFDHAMAMNSKDPLLATLQARGDRVVVFDGLDPTTEVLARRIFEEVAGKIGQRFSARDGLSYTLPASLRVERVRVSETATTWAEFAR
jgi:6-pyruvoyltetrahydropterin/6-carboxytetrahydropterin synthase